MKQAHNLRINKVKFDDKKLTSNFSFKNNWLQLIINEGNNFTHLTGYISKDEKQIEFYNKELRIYDVKIIGYNFEKGMTIENLMNQVYLSNIDLLITDYELNTTNLVAFNGDVVEDEMYYNKPQFPLIVLTDKIEEAEAFIQDWKIIFEKDKIFRNQKSKARFANILFYMVYGFTFRSQSYN